MTKIKWIRVNDKLPDEEQKVLICGEGGTIDIAYIGWDNCWYNWMTNHIVIWDVTHWTELPELPKESE